MAAVVAIASLSPRSAPAPEVTRVLFIGNSLTTVNDVPAIVGRLASASNQRFSYRTVAFDGYSLEDHWNRGDARRAIADGGWSIVVLQQGRLHVRNRACCCASTSNGSTRRHGE